MPERANGGTAVLTHEAPGSSRPAPRTSRVPPLAGWAKLTLVAFCVAAVVLFGYASIAPWPERAIKQGVFGDLLAEMRRERQRLVSASERLARASVLLDSVDLQALAAVPRLERAARLVGAFRTQQADVADVLALAA